MEIPGRRDGKNGSSNYWNRRFTLEQGCGILLSTKIGSAHLCNGSRKFWNKSTEKREGTSDHNNNLIMYRLLMNFPFIKIIINYY